MSVDFDDDEEPCVCADRVKQGQAYHCQICDAEWPADEDDDALATPETKEAR